MFSGTSTSTIENLSGAGKVDPHESLQDKIDDQKRYSLSLLATSNCKACTDLLTRDQSCHCTCVCAVDSSTFLLKKSIMLQQL